MPTWKLNIFVRVIRARTEAESRTVEDIIVEYTRLTDLEKQQILANII